MKNLSQIAFPCVAFFLVTALCASDVLAQPGGRGGRGGRPGQGQGNFRGRGDDNQQRLLRNESVQKELELSEEQIEQLNEMSDGRDRNRSREDLRAELEGLSDDERIERIRELRDERTNAQKEALSEVLLPHQMERLSQIAAQMSAQGSRGLLGGSIAEKLNITDEQKERLREKAEELQKELNEKIAKLREQMQQQLLGELTPEQQQQYKEMMGDKFTLERQQRAGGEGRGGFGGQRGGPGGQRGGAGGGGRGGDRGGIGGRGGRGGDRGGRGGDRGGRGGDRGGDQNERGSDFDA